MNVSSQQRIAGHYVLLETIGKGGMGEVFLGLDERLDRQVAIKRLNIGQDQDNLQRFHQEAKAVARLNHPHIVSLYDIAMEEQAFYMVMEYVKGLNVQDMIQNQRLPLSLVIHMGIQLCQALEQAHRQGIVHRDIKPANLLLTEDQQLKLTDFGIAQLNQSQDLRLTQSGTMLGSFLYAAPEQLVNAADIDARSDLYAVGATLYELLTGRTVYSADNVGQLIQKVFMEPVVPPKAWADIPLSLNDILMRCLAKKPEERYASAAELRQALQSLQSEVPVPSLELTSPPVADTRQSALQLLKTSPQPAGPGLWQSLQQHAQWLESYLQSCQCVHHAVNFAQAKKHIQQADLQGKTFSGILVFPDTYVFVRNGLIVGAFNPTQQKLNDAALKGLQEQTALQCSYVLPPEWVLTLACLLSGAGTTVQEHLDSRVVNLFAIAAELAEESFSGYVVCQSLQEASTSIVLYHQGTQMLGLVKQNQQWELSHLPLSKYLEQPCLLSIYMPTHQMLDTVLYDFLTLAEVHPQWRSPDDTTPSSLAASRENLSEWMRSSLYDGLRNNLDLQLLTQEGASFPEMLQEALLKRPEFAAIQWLALELLISLHAHGQWQHFEQLYQALPQISHWRFYQTLRTDSRTMLCSLVGYLDQQPAIIAQSGQGSPEVVQSFFQEVAHPHLLAALYLSQNGFEAQTTAWYNTFVEKLGFFQKQKGFVKAKGKAGFHAFLVDLQGQRPQITAPHF